ncbi:hypothetical protein ASD52_30135 [Ensifer sp. Root142]|nr:hypothetical protein ASD52_30135 [Ensifer sp. Root142]
MPKGDKAEPAPKDKKHGNMVEIAAGRRKTLGKARKAVKQQARIPIVARDSRRAPKGQPWFP